MQWTPFRNFHFGSIISAARRPYPQKRGHCSKLTTIAPHLCWRSRTKIPSGARAFSKNRKLRSVLETKMPIWSNLAVVKTKPGVPDKCEAR